MAIVCDDLIQHGGHEHIIMEFCRLYPQATLFTTMATKKWQTICRENKIELKTSFMQKLPFKRRLNRFYAPFLLYILALESFSFDDYDVVVSLTSRFSQGVITKPGTLHICYLSTVGRMFWEPQGYFMHEGFGRLPIFKKLARTFLSLPLSYIRLWDRTASQRPDIFITISKTSQERIRKYYQREAQVIYPPVDIRKYIPGPATAGEDYFLVATRLASWKRVDIAIKACLEQNMRLKIMGEGPDKSRLEKLAGGSDLIKFLGFVSEAEKISYMQNCQALIMTQFEDFGLVPIEAGACGKPTIAFAKGGVLETVVEGRTGMFYDEQNEHSLGQVLKKFEAKKYRAEDCQAQAKKFSLEEFQSRMSRSVSDNLKSYNAR